jgi:predicted dehydrogenase
MLDPPIKLAIVGCGAITDISHLPAAVRSPAINVTALVDTVPANARALARKYGLQGCTIADDLTAVVDKVEGVLIAAPNHAHFPLAQIALSHRRPVLVEKPLTASYQDSVALCDLAEEQGTFISVGYFTRHYPSVRLLKQLLETGYLGKITFFDYEHGAKGGWEPVSGYSLDPEKAGGGILLVRGTHLIDRMLHLFGYPESFAYSDDNYGAVEANCKADLWFRNETDSYEGKLFLSKTRPLKNQLTLHTELYVCILEEENSESLTLFPLNRPNLALEASPKGWRPAGPPPSYFQVQLEEFASLVRKGGRPTVDGRYAAQSIKLIEDMYRHRSQLEEPWLTYRSRLPAARALHG